MAKWMQKAFAKNKGALHRQTGTPAGEDIPSEKLAAAAKRPGKEGMRARLAITAKKIAARKKGKGK